MKLNKQKYALRTECDKLWSTLIFKLFRGQCAWCGRPNIEVHSHHIKKRSQCSIFEKYHPLNGMSLCAWPLRDGEQSCHDYCDTHGEEVMEWLKTNLPLHYSFLDNMPKIRPNIGLSAVKKQLMQLHESYDIRPTPQIIPRCHLPPHMMEELLKRSIVNINEKEVDHDE